MGARLVFKKGTLQYPDMSPRRGLPTQPASPGPFIEEARLSREVDVCVFLATDMVVVTIIRAVHSENTDRYKTTL